MHSLFSSAAARFGALGVLFALSACGAEAPIADDSVFAGDTTCALTEPLDAGGIIAYDDGQSGHATARGGELVLGVPTRMYADRKATVVLDEGRWSARVAFTEDAPIPTCTAAVTLEPSARVDFRASAEPGKGRISACGQALAVEGGRATLWVPPSHLAEGCTAREVRIDGGSVKEVGAAVGLDASHAGTLVNLAAP